MKIAIVGARESKWTKSQKKKVKDEIEQILFRYGGRVSYKVGFEFGHLTFISGHCPKGGVDIWAEEIADELEISKIIFKPEINYWEDFPSTSGSHKLLKGFRTRNMEIAKECDILYCLVPKRLVGKPIFLNKDLTCIHCNLNGHPTNGGCWTMNYAKKLGKKTFLIEIE